MSEPDQIEDVRLPEEQSQLIGHAEARAAILGRLHGGTLPNAVLIHGPLGIGKATLAFALARDIITATGDEDAHRVDEQVAAKSHPNLFVLRRQPKDAKGFYTVIRVDDVRELRERMHKTRGRTGHRVAIIDSIDDCNVNAANALLKTLEEPPSDTIFLLISHRPGQLLPTIKSRCHSLALRPLSSGEVHTVLAANSEADPVALEQAVTMADGRPRRAYEALLLGPDTALGALRNWLANPLNFASGAHLALADTLMSDAQGTEARFARDMVIDWLAGEARTAAIAGPEARRRLASANELWEKAHAQFADAEALNLDARQTLISIFDAIRRHLRLNASAAIETP